MGRLSNYSLGQIIAFLGIVWSSGRPIFSKGVYNVSRLFEGCRYLFLIVGQEGLKNSSPSIAQTLEFPASGIWNIHIPALEKFEHGKHVRFTLSHVAQIFMYASHVPTFQQQANCVSLKHSLLFLSCIWSIVENIHTVLF